MKPQNLKIFITSMIAGLLALMLIHLGANYVEEILCEEVLICEEQS